MGAERCIQVGSKIVYFVQHGMRGSVGGIWYEVQLEGGFVAGRIWSYTTTLPRGGERTLWKGRISRYESYLGPFHSRLDGTKAILAEYEKRNPERPAYLKDCEVCEGKGCKACYVGEQ